ncbi:MAG: hypothetical protein WB621_06290 [Candidatus Acidiferrales bacterium]
MHAARVISNDLLAVNIQQRAANPAPLQFRSTHPGSNSLGD